MTVAQPSTTTLRAVVTTFAGVAIISTIFRLSYRYRVHRLWLDDGWAAVSVAAQFTLLVNLWIRTDTPDVGPLHQSKHNRIIAYWIVSLSFTFTLWAARMSQLFSVIRIIPDIMKMRKVAYGMSGLFGAMWIALLVQKVYICKRDTSWYLAAKPQCHLGHAVASTELATDFISDAMLVVVPLRLLWRVSMNPSQRRLLFSIFSAGIFTTIVSVVHAYFELGPSGLLEATTANVEASVSLIVANLAVIVTYIYRLVRGGSDVDNTVYVASQGGSSRSRRNTFGMKRITKNSTSSPSGGQLSTLRFDKDTRILSTNSEDPFVKSMHPFDDEDVSRAGIKASAPRVFITQETFLATDPEDIQGGRKPLPV